MDTDAIAGAAVGLLGTAILIDVAGRVIKPKPIKVKPKEPKIKW